MTMTDPIADLLTRLRNANMAMHEDVRMPSSRLKEALAALLYQEGYISGYAVTQEPNRPHQTLTIRLKYSPERLRTITGLRRVSKPGLRVYSKADRVPAGAGRARRGRAVDQPGAHDRPRGPQEGRRRRDPLLRVVKP